MRRFRASLPSEFVKEEVDSQTGLLQRTALVAGALTLLLLLLTAPVSTAELFPVSLGNGAKKGPKEGNSVRQNRQFPLPASMDGASWLLRERAGRTLVVSRV
jgi:hypothetical protein